MRDTDYKQRVLALHAQLGISADFMDSTALSFYEEPGELVPTEVDFYGREQRLTSNAYSAWLEMRSQAAKAGVKLLMISAYRGIDYQAKLIQRKLDAGQALEEILCVNAAPGFSEHHTGRAIDIASPECPQLEEAFERTAAFLWLQSNASDFGFTMSFPRENNCGIIYEPWHWCYKE
ncbi:MAG: M15 family metallopeptidase [Gammaproteobacteria bacterium]